jgi:hypothetical protein
LHAAQIDFFEIRSYGSVRLNGLARASRLDAPDK